MSKQAAWQNSEELKKKLLTALKGDPTNNLYSLVFKFGDFSKWGGYHECDHFFVSETFGIPIELVETYWDALDEIPINDSSEFTKKVIESIPVGELEGVITTDELIEAIEGVVNETP